MIEHVFRVSCAYEGGRATARLVVLRHLDVHCEAAGCPHGVGGECSPLQLELHVARTHVSALVEGAVPGREHVLCGPQQRIERDF